jgi:thermitase
MTTILRILSLMIIVTMLFSSMGIQPAAAQTIMPDPPLYVTASFVPDNPTIPKDTSHVRLNWAASINKTGYNIYRRPAGSGIWLAVADYSDYSPPAYNSGLTGYIGTSQIAIGHYVYKVCAGLLINGQFVQSCTESNSVHIGFSPDDDPQEWDPIIAQQLLVNFKPEVSPDARRAARERYGANLIRLLNKSEVELWEVPEGQEFDLVSRLSSDPEIDYAEPNFVYEALVTPNDPDFNKQWGQTLIQSPAAWNVTTGSNLVTIAVIDTGIDETHPDLASKIVAGYDSVDNATPHDGYGHGTHVAGIAAAATNNAVGIAGMSWGARIMPIRVLGNDGVGNAANVTEGILWAYQHGAKVLNLSLGSTGYSQAMQDAIHQAHLAGSLVVAAMGNCRVANPPYCATNPTSYPAAYANVMAVAAVGPNDQFAPYSQYGPHNDIAAPGGAMSSLHAPGGIYSTMPSYQVTMNSSGYSQNYDYLQGTSMAAPHVAGLAALCLSIAPYLTPNTVQNIIQNTAVDKGAPGWDQDYGYGRINALAAVQQCARQDPWIEDTQYNGGPVDVGNEPNLEMLVPGVWWWASKSIWVRHLQDGVFQHQDPEYSLTVPNYVYAHINYFGGTTRSGTVTFYWADGNANQLWPWQSIGSASLTLLPGTSADVNVAWWPPGTGHYCIVALWESAGDPLHAALTPDLYQNVYQNNNMAWRNMGVVDLIIGDKGEIFSLETGNLATAGKINLAIRPSPYHMQREWLQQIEVRATLPVTTYELWRELGTPGKGFRLLEAPQILVVDPEGAILRDLPMEKGEAGIVTLQLAPLPEAKAGQYDMAVIQSINPVTGTEVEQGGFAYQINLAPPVRFLTVTKTGAGSGSVTSNPAGINCGTDCTEDYVLSTTVTLTATAAAGSTFAGWSGDATSSVTPATVMMTANKAVTATFNLIPITYYTLTITTTGTGSGTVIKSPAQISYTAGTVVSLTATANTESTFAGWSGDLSGSVNPTSITMTGNKTVTATFSLNTYTLTVAIVGNGLVTPTVGTHAYPYGAVVPITATANTGSIFAGWSGDLSGNVNPISITMMGNKTVTATFQAFNDPCASPTIKSVNGGEWNIPATWTRVSGGNSLLPLPADVILIASPAVVTAPLPINASPSITLGQNGVLCIAAGAVLRSAPNTLTLNIDATSPSSELVINPAGSNPVGAIYNQGKIIGADGMKGEGTLPSSSCSWWDTSSCGLYKRATDGSSIRINVGTLENGLTGEIISGNGGDDRTQEYMDGPHFGYPADRPNPFPPFYYTSPGTGYWGIRTQGGKGGGVEIYTAQTIKNYGLIKSGKGGEGDSWDPITDQPGSVHGTTVGGDGGSVYLNATAIATSLNAGTIVGGCGGAADISYMFAGDSHAGSGGSITVFLAGMYGTVVGCPDQGTVIHWDPITMTVSQNTKMQADNVMIYGPKDWTMDLSELSEGAIVASQTITLAIGSGGTIDLRGVSGKAFSAGAKFEVFADNILLDAGVSITDLVSAPEIRVKGAKTIYRVDLSTAQNVVGELGVVLPVQLQLRNNGTETDTYALSASDSAGWQLESLPVTMSLEALTSAELTLEVRIPQTGGVSDTITVTATSQTDSTVIATAAVQVSRFKSFQIFLPMIRKQ